MLESDVNKLSY